MKNKTFTDCRCLLCSHFGMSVEKAALNQAGGVLGPHFPLLDTRGQQHCVARGPGLSPRTLQFLDEP